MKISYREEAYERKKEACVITEYPLKDAMLDCVMAEIQGRYPVAGRVSNQKCKLMAYVKEGQGKLQVEGKEVLLKRGDLILIEPGEKYCWDGHLTLFVSCTPAWYPEQHVQVD
jgi:hypothetical protein